MVGYSGTIDEKQPVAMQAYHHPVEISDITRARHTDEIVKRLISALPKDMRRERWSRSKKNLCKVHQGLNPDIMYDVFRLLQREVGHHLRKFDAYPHLLKPLDILILKKLQAIRGMWKRPDPEDPDAPNAWDYETSCCQGCMVARVASDKSALRNLRIALLSRTQTRLKHVPRRLMKFIDSCIDLFPDDVDELYGTSSQFAYILKDTRKACSKAWARDPAHADSRRRRHGDGSRHGADNSGKTKRSNKSVRNHSPTTEYNPRKKYAQPPPPISVSHPVERYAPNPSFSSRRTDPNMEGASTYHPTSSLSRKVSSSPDHVKRYRRRSPDSDRITRLMDFADDNYQELEVSAVARTASSVYGPPGNPPSPSVASAAYGTLDEINELLEMYQSLGTNPYLEDTPEHSSPSICTTSCEWTDEGEYRNRREAERSSARTTWDLVCEQSNMI
ncbi:uncharacterized protein N7515_007578 [Penicillium bovifimosum]|uniref:Uncharacterized protein n=1 Tax=Penicillium bovifimosum TaxID=126998 RepID=A0A9W9L1T8_9EURO|nr:uncharacterized protein N7515_007578 [Penicillium bovifimosum]KAJ5131539.1 hypothetical protein N7515_007578 [Penicillium bovifimosum]